ncbi:hypothetical protein COV13_03020 [Candidatus Woesearchaeota archaeon CG10_big_fil_rev_8_21_14_0_10_32_9]|nr:MAG: hypothetical protein COV13_03020 [Candidatus Woesearchaeota archaeon CG10_big_fil_rev_8_21_14_0_10_32_9]
MVERIKDIQDEGIRKLAETLRSSGLAASETEAIRIATGMSRTNTKVNQNFEERKGSASTMLSNMNKVYPKREESSTDNHFQQQVQRSEAKSQETHETHHCQEKHDHMHKSEECCGHCHHVEEEVEIVKYTDSEEPKQDIFDVKEEDELIHQELVSRASEVKKEQENSPKEATLSEVVEPENNDKPKQVWDERKPKKDITKMEEYRIDLGSVFKFKG